MQSGKILTIWQKICSIVKLWPDISLTFQILLLLWTVNLKCSKLDSEKTCGTAEVSIVEIRYITPADDKMTISRIYEESWKYAYKGIIPQDYLESLPEGRWVANLENSNWGTLVCVDSGRIVGTSSFCESRFNQFKGWGEIISIYLLPDYMGRGFGKALFHSVIEELKKMGYRNIFLWVLEKNLRARKFYEKEGFSMSDDYLDDNIGGKDVREIRYIYREE